MAAARRCRRRSRRHRLALAPSCCVARVRRSGPAVTPDCSDANTHGPERHGLDADGAPSFEDTSVSDERRAPGADTSATPEAVVLERTDSAGDSSTRISDAPDARKAAIRRDASTEDRSRAPRPIARPRPTARARPTPTQNLTRHVVADVARPSPAPLIGRRLTPTSRRDVSSSKRLGNKPAQAPGVFLGLISGGALLS